MEEAAQMDPSSTTATPGPKTRMRVGRTCAALHETVRGWAPSCLDAPLPRPFHLWVPCSLRPPPELVLKAHEPALEDAHCCCAACPSPPRCAAGSRRVASGQPHDAAARLGEAVPLDLMAVKEALAVQVSGLSLLHLVAQDQLGVDSVECLWLDVQRRGKHHRAPAP